MLKLPMIDKNSVNFSFNKFASAPSSPQNQNNIINQYVQQRHQNLLQYIKQGQNTKFNSPKKNKTSFQFDLLKFIKKKQSHLFQSSPIHCDASNYQINQVVETDDTLFAQIKEIQHDFEQFSQHLPQQENQLQPQTYTTMRKSVTSEGQSKINQYTILQELGRGSFGKVKLAKDDLNQYAVKICDRKKLKLKLLTSKIDAFTLLDREIAIMKKIDHDNIVKLYEVIENTNNEKLYLILEYMDGPQLLDSNLNMDLIWQLFRDFIKGLDYLHNHAHIVHMDIKPENLLLNQQMQLKIADFGVSQIMEDDFVKSRLGTSAYQPPEIFKNNEYIKGKPVDIWAAGITLFQMIYKYHPFQAKTNEQVKHNILYEEIKWLDNPQHYDVQDLLKKMLQKDVEQRITVEQILKHKWITKNEQISLKNNYQGILEVNEHEIKNAITKLSFNIAIKTVNVMKQSLAKSRKRLSEQKSLQI